MKNLSFILLLVLASCNGSTPENEMADNENSGTEQAAKEWLTTAIPAFFEGTDMALNTIATPEYAEYKTDAMNLLYGELTIPMFEKKWQGKYDVSEEAVGKAFLIDAQDYVKIEVESCELSSTTEEGWSFKTKLVDKAMKMEVTQNIEVVPFEGSYRISNVK